MRARYRKPKRRRGGSMGWNAAIAVVVILGVGLIVFTRSNDTSSAGTGPPRAANQAAGTPGDHWHTAVGVDICGDWLSAEPEFEQAAGAPSGTQGVGLHTHGDGLIHTEPVSTVDEGNNATLGRFASYGGWSVSSDSIDGWAGPAGKPDQKSWSNGDTCPFGKYKGQKGQIAWAVDGKTRAGNPSDYRQQDGRTIAIGFLPKGVKLPFPPDACAAFTKNAPGVVRTGSPCDTQDTVPTTTAPVSTEPPTTTLAP
jgi:hypothetical protein